MLLSPLSRSSKIVPTSDSNPISILDNAELMRQIEAAVAIKNKPDSEFGASNQSQRARRPSLKNSFIFNANTTPVANGLERLINFLRDNKELINTEKEYLEKFEALIKDIQKENSDQDLKGILESHGLSESRYRNSQEVGLEVDSLQQALSNLYLRKKVRKNTAEISDLFGKGEEKKAVEIISFCPELLVNCIKNIGPPTQGESGEVKSYSFTGACMLADISGFSKFSASMCSKGVEGLDELRAATDVFLGHIVKTVYRFDGDGEPPFIYPWLIEIIH